MVIRQNRPRQISVVVPKEVREFFIGVTANGHGGFQSLCRMLKVSLEESEVLTVSPEDFQRIVRYATAYGEGGYQARLRTIIANWVSQHMEDLF